MTSKEKRESGMLKFVYLGSASITKETYILYEWCLKKMPKTKSKIVVRANLCVSRGYRERRNEDLLPRILNIIKLL